MSRISPRYAKSYEMAAAWTGLSLEEVRRQVEDGVALIVVIDGTPVIDSMTLRGARRVRTFNFNTNGSDVINAALRDDAVYDPKITYLALAKKKTEGV